MNRLGLGLYNELPLTPEEYVEATITAEKLGFHSIWIPEDYFGRDAISLATLLASVTQRIHIGIGVVSSFARAPVVTAMSFATLDEISRGRAILGIGSSAERIVSKMGVNYRKPLTRNRECIELIRRLIAGEKVTYSGETINVQEAKLAFKTFRKKTPIYLGAMGPRMLQLAGEIADGVILSAGGTPDYVRSALQEVRKGAEGEGREFRDVCVACYICCAVSEKPELLLDEVKYYIAEFIQYEEPGYQMMFESSGLTEEQLTAIRNAKRREDRYTVSKVVTDELVHAVCAFGNPHECSKKILEYISAGVNLPIILPLACSPKDAAILLGDGS